MISDDAIQNAILHRPNSKTKRPPFLIPLHDPSLSTFHTGSKVFTAASNDKSVGSRKSIRILRPETIKRAINDACMAAAIGDLEWLKQTFKISNEIAFDKDGFATIHLASIHGRINILRYLIEEQNYDPNFPSAVHAWCPIHLCISNQIGSRSIECLKYLIEKGALINIKNADDIYPLHMAASEGQIECLKILLELKADATVQDKRGQTPLDLARLWGHRTCAKLLGSYLWNLEKKARAEQQAFENKVKTQEILKEVEQAHHNYYTDKDESQKNFDQWLLNQGFLKTEEPPIPPKEKKEKKPSTLPTFLLIPDPDDTQKPDIDQNLNSQPEIDAQKVENKKSLFVKQRPKLTELKAHHSKDWNFSTKPKRLEYIPNLKDFYPRDPYTLLPANVDLVLLNRELRGMTFDDVKAFMKKQLKNDSTNTNKQDERPIYHKPRNIIDTPSKMKLDEDEKGIDQAGLFLGNDPESFPFKQVKQTLSKSLENFQDQHTEFYYPTSYGKYYDTKGTLKQIKKQLAPGKNIKDDRLEIIRNSYGEDLRDFMMDKRHGNINQKYDKVFIV